MFKKPHEPRSRVVTRLTKPSRAKQSMRDECDINNIMAKYQKTGLLSHVSEYGGQYGDATGVDFHTAQNMIIEANETFQSLPSSIRKKFDNDPAQFLEFVSDDSNIPAMRDLGLIPQQPNQAAETVSVVPPTTEAEETVQPPQGAIKDA